MGFSCRHSSETVNPCSALYGVRRWSSKAQHPSAGNLSSWFIEQVHCSFRLCFVKQQNHVVCKSGSSPDLASLAVLKLADLDL